MRKLFKWVKDNPNRTMFLVPILLVAGISISHVVSWYDIANPISWAIYLSIAIEVAAMTALVAATNRIKGGVWFMFILVTIIQMIGNIFFSFKEIDANGDLFKSWVELTGPLWEMLGSDPGDVISQKRWLAFLEGGLLPIISLTSLHFFTKYDRTDSNGNEEVKEVPIITKPDENITEEEYSKIIDEFVRRQKEESEKIKYTPKEEDLEKLDEFLNNVGYDGPKKTETDESVKFTPSDEELKKIEDILLNQSKNISQEEEIFTDNIEDIEKVKRALIDYNKEDINFDNDENEYVELSNPEPINKVLNYSKRDE